MAGLKYRGRRKAYVDDYKINEKGEYEYQGVRYQWNLGEAEGKRLLLHFRLLGPVIFGCMLVAGCIPAPGVNFWPFLMIPYLAGVVASVSLWIVLWQMCGEKSPMREHVYKESVEKLPFRTLLTGILAFAAVIGEIVFVCLYGFLGHAVSAVFFIILEVLALAGVIYIRKRAGDLKWERV